jgi:predicted DNA-binding transcriptional regulator YafY
MTTRPETETAAPLLRIIADLLRGQRHTRRTIVAATGRSLATADRWIEQIVDTIPNVRRVRSGRATEIVYETRQEMPTKTAVVGACISASLASVFEGSQQERNLKDARDYLLRLRGESYGDLDRKFFFAAKGGEISLPEKREELDEVVDALLTDAALSFTYAHNDGSVDKLHVAPLSLVIFDHQFYLLARRHDASLYAYRFARMSSVERGDETVAYPTKGEYDPRTVFGPLFGIHVAARGSVEDVEALLEEPWATYALSHRWHGSQQVSRLDDGRVRVTLRVRLCREVEAWALGFGEQGQIVRPDALRARIAKRVGDAAAKYAVGPTLSKARARKPGKGIAKAKAGATSTQAPRTRSR